MEGLVSVIMPSYNTEKYIGASIRSVINQTYKNWELIIIDDCSVDGTIGVVSGFKDERIRLIVNKKNVGAALSRNRALEEAKGKYIAFLDADDIWETRKLEFQIKFMQRHKYSFTYTDYRIRLNGKWSQYICTAPDKVDLRKLYNYCYFSTITVMYDVDVVGLIQIEDLKKNNDYAMWFKALEKTVAHRIPKCLSYYIKHDDSVSGGSKLKLIKWYYLLYRKELKKGKMEAVLLTGNNVVHGIMKKIIYRKRVVGLPALTYEGDIGRREG